MSKGRFNFAQNVSWACLIQSVMLRIFLFNPIALNLFPLVRVSQNGFPYTSRI